MAHFFGLARFQPNPEPTRPPLQACVDPIFTGRAGPLGPNFLHILTERVQFHLMVHFFGFARFQPNPDPTRPPLQACVDPIFMGRAGPLGPNFLHILTERVQFYLMVHFFWARALPTKPGPHPATPTERVQFYLMVHFFWARALPIKPGLHPATHSGMC